MAISDGDLNNFFSDENFKIMLEDGDIITLERSYDFLEYFEFWVNCRDFGLPSGNGWINELPWVVDFVKYFNKISNEIDIFDAKKK